MGSGASRDTFEIDNGNLPKFNDTHKEPIIDTYEKLPITFYLNENTFSCARMYFFLFQLQLERNAMMGIQSI